MIEAMACGSPFVGAEITGIVDHVRDGETGFLVKPGDVQTLAEKLRLILRNGSLAEEVGHRGSDYIRQQLDWSLVVCQS